MPTKPISIRLDEHLLAYLTERAEKEHRTLSNMISSILAEANDAVRVVRCQKCEHYCGEETYTNHRICKVWKEEVFANGFCYEGNPKE